MFLTQTPMIKTNSNRVSKGVGSSIGGDVIKLKDNDHTASIAGYLNSSLMGDDEVPHSSLSIM
jgi:hypothetical protein